MGTVKQTLHIEITPHPIDYEVIIGENLLEEAFSFVQKTFSHFLVITTPPVYQQIAPIKYDKIFLPEGESIKSRAMKAQIEDALIERGWGRDVCLMGIGGGALLDIVGFVAATYCRGVPFVSIPSTLIAMTDASIGGKTGINVDEAKNWIGAYHNPRKVFVDTFLLKSLPEKEYVTGLAETIKHALVADQELFLFLETHLEAILKRETSVLEEMIYRSCSVKKRVVEQDPYEKDGLRRILNYGHTVGHALETLSNYTRSHGQAVMMGMWLEAAIAHRMDYLSHTTFERIAAFFERIPFSRSLPDHIPYEMMKRDKKGSHCFVVLTDIGKVAPFEGEYVTPMTKELFEAGVSDVMCPH